MRPRISRDAQAWLTANEIGALVGPTDPWIVG